jgi:hypothetical protein
LVHFSLGIKILPTNLLALQQTRLLYTPQSRIRDMQQTAYFVTTVEAIFLWLLHIIADMLLFEASTNSLVDYIFKLFPT